MEGFREGFYFFEKNTGGFYGSISGAAYVSDVEKSIDNLKEHLNEFGGYQTKPDALKGDVAEFWHSDTFNIDAIVKGSKNRTYVDRSHDFASADISSNFGKKFGLKYYKNGIESAKQQAKSVFERFKEYQNGGGKDSIDEFLFKRGLNNIDEVLNDPIYSGQMRVIPKDQLEEAKEWLRRKILEEGSKRPEQVKRYQETLDMLSDKLKDGKGVESIPLTKEEAEYLAKLAREGRVSRETLKELGISTEDLIKFEYIMKQAFKAGLSAATISMVLKVVPEIYKAIAYLVQTGKFDEKSFQNVGFAAIQGGGEGFIRGTISAAITSAVKSGLWGETIKKVDPSIIGAVTVITLNTMQNAFKVATGKMQTREMTNDLVKEMFITTCSLVGGSISQSFIEIPVLGFMLGSFLGSVVGSFTYNLGCNVVLSLCIKSGFTMFGLVEQNYRVPEDVMEAIGFEVFKYEKFQNEKFSYEQFQPEAFEFEKNKTESLDISFLRRGVISIHKVGYVL